MLKSNLIVLLILFPFITLSQNTNFRAQGNYYSAKENFQKKAYSTAITYVEKSKQNLGGTNRELQYLHILCAYNLENFDLALKELETYFALEEDKIKSVDFDKSVDKLTNDETKELTKLIDPIYEKAENKNKNGRIAVLIDDLNKLLTENCSGLYNRRKDSEFIKNAMNYSERATIFNIPHFTFDNKTGILTCYISFTSEYSSRGKSWGWKSKKTRYDYKYTYNVKDLKSISLAKGDEYYKNDSNCSSLSISFKNSAYSTYSYEIIEATGDSAHVLGEKRIGLKSDTPEDNFYIEIPNSNISIKDKIEEILFEMAK